MSYWKDRETAARQALLGKSHKEINTRLKKYYVRISKQLINEYETLYDKVLLKKEAGEQISPATLYQLDKYWELQAQTRKHLNKLGAFQQSLLSKVFEVFYQKSYHSINIKGLKAFRTLDEAAVKQVINSIWCADNKSWSQRIWENTAQLQQTLEEGLIECVAAGRKTSQLKEVLQERFNVSYGRASTLATTELAHIQTAAAQQRYKDYGITEYEFYADEDERRCPHCGKLHQKKFPIDSTPKVPLHPNCRCVILPVIKDDE